MSQSSQNSKAITEKLPNLTIKGQVLELQCYSNVSAITSLEDEWQALEQINTEDFTYFQNYNWCIEYFRQFADDVSDKHCPIPRVFVLRKDNKPIMIWPMMRVQSRTGLKLLMAATEPLGQYCNLIFDPAAFNAEIGQATLNLIIENSKSDAASLNYYPKDCMIDKIIGERGIKENSTLEASILDFTQYKSWEAYSSTLSKGQRKERRRNKNKLEAKGDLTCDVHFAGTKQYEALIALALKLKSQWLEQTGRKPGLLASQETKAMFTNLDVSQSNSETVPLVHALYVDGKPIAIEIGMIDADRYYSYLGAIDWEWKDFGPGKVQMAMAQEWCMEKGIKYFDLLHDPSEYKHSWTNHTHTVLTRNIPITFKGYVYSKLWKTYIRPKMKSIYHFAGAKNRDRINKFAKIFSK